MKKSKLKSMGIAEASDYFDEHDIFEDVAKSIGSDIEISNSLFNTLYLFMEISKERFFISDKFSSVHEKLDITRNYFIFIDIIIIFNLALLMYVMERGGGRCGRRSYR